MPAALLMLLAAGGAIAGGAVQVPAGTTLVRPGETIGHVAARTGVGVEALARANRIAPPWRIAPGRRLVVPAGRYHRVRAGETGIGIARAYDVPWARILAENGLAAPYGLRAGQRLLIPEPARPRSIEQRAAAFHLDIDDLVTGSAPAVTKRERLADPPPATPAPGATRFGWPAEGRVVAGFGPSDDGRLSEGIVIATRAGRPIRAAADGTILYAGTAIPALGRLLLVRHAGGWTSAYAHAAALSVRRGQAVRRDQPLGRTGDRLLFQLRRGRAATDPIPLLPPRP